MAICHPTQLLATYAKDFTGIDLTDYGVNSTSKRIELFGLKNARILQMNAEDLKFEDNSFDFVWSWGVIHHSANPRRILREIHRVLKPGGLFKAMIYYRSFWSYYAFAILTGIFKGYFFKGDSLHEAAQKITDGAIARSYSRKEWRQELADAGLQSGHPNSRPEIRDSADSRKPPEICDSRGSSEPAQPFHDQQSGYGKLYRLNGEKAVKAQFAMFPTSPLCRW